MLLLPLFPILWLILRNRWRDHKSIAFSSQSLFEIKKKKPELLRNPAKHLPFLLRLAALSLLIFAICRPQSEKSESTKKSSGLDIILAVDSSQSMSQRDYVLNGSAMSRMAVVKEVVAEFVSSRPFDRIGLVVFGDFAFTRSPLTLDHQVLHEYIEDLEIGVAGGKTAIGDAIAIAVKRIKDIKSKSKIVILLTDGEDNSSQIRPIDAADIAKTLKTKVYTIGMQSGAARGMLRRFYQRESSVSELKKIAEKTDGKFFKVKNTESLREVYKEIDRLEKSEIEEKNFVHYDEKYHGFLLLGLVFLMAEFLTRLTPFERIP